MTTTPAPPSTFLATGIAIVALVLTGCDKGDAAVTPGAGSATTAPAGGTAAAPPALPSYWFESDFDEWIGRRWDEIDLLRFIGRVPRDIETGTRYVVFYGRTCEHCEAMFKEDLAPSPDLAAQVTAVEVPVDTNVLTSPDAWAMPDTACELLALPLGPNWIITTPLALRIENGVVRCAEEGEHRNCMGLPGGEG